jgi:flagellar hook-associated protein 3 FlgL
VLNTRKQISNVDRYLETMGKSLDTMQATDGHLGHVENIMQRAKEIMTNAVNGSLNDADRTVLADELVQIAQGVARCSQRHGGRQTPLCRIRGRHRTFC